jgi:hypothetical protein
MRMRGRRLVSTFDTTLLPYTLCKRYMWRLGQTLMRHQKRSTMVSHYNGKRKAACPGGYICSG